MGQGNMEIRISKRKLKSIVKFFAVFTLFMLLAIALSSAQRLPNIGSDQNDWGTVLNQFLNVSHAENGALKTGMNLSVHNLNATGNITSTGAINATNITATRFTGKISCGMLDDGTDTDFCIDANSGTQPTTSQIFKNITLSVSEIGMINETNTTWVQGQKVLNATWSDNSSGVEWDKISKIPAGFADGVDDTGSGGGITNGSSGNLTNLNVLTLNGTPLNLFNKSISLDGYVLLLGAPFSNMQNNNISSYLGDTNNTIIRLNQSNKGNVTISGLGNFTTLNGTLDCSNIMFSGGALGASAICDGVDATGTGGDFSNYQLDNTSDFLGRTNTTILRLINFTNLYEQQAYFKIGNFTSSLGDRNSSIPDVKNNATFFDFHKTTTFNRGNISNNTYWDALLGIPSTLPTVWSIANVSNKSSWGTLQDIPTTLPTVWSISNVSNNTYWNALLGVPITLPTVWSLSNVSNNSNWATLLSIPSTLPTVWSLSNVSNNTYWDAILSKPAGIVTDFSISTNISNYTQYLTNISDAKLNNLNLSINLTIQENQTSRYASGTGNIGLTETWNGTCFIRRNLVSGNNETLC